MKNNEKLIFIYFYICDRYDTDLVTYCQRLSNNSQPAFSDEEVLTIFFYCLLIEKQKEVKDIYNFADNHLRSWFPNLPKTYPGYLGRLNNLGSVFPSIIHHLIGLKMAKIADEQWMLFENLMSSVVDSMPIILATGKRSFAAKVALQSCDKGYCSTKKLHYHGVKLHVMGFRRFGKLPVPEYVGTTPASYNDLSAFKSEWENLHNRVIFGDKIYKNKAWEQFLAKYNNVHLFSPVKKKKGQKFLKATDKFLSRTISQIRQPIESFFNWIIEKVAIQKASKVRSEKGLLVHVYGRFAAAMMLFAFDNL